MWSDVKIIHEKSRHSQNQNSIVRVNSDLEDMLATCMAQSNTKDWLNDLKYIQLKKKKKSRFYSGISL